MDCKNCKHGLVLGCGHNACRHPALDQIYDNPMILLMALTGDAFSSIPARVVDGVETMMVEIDEKDIRENNVKFPFHYNADFVKRCVWREEELVAAARETDWVVKDDV